MRQLILGCSATKRPDPGLLPALERYDGPTFRTLRHFLRQQPSQSDALAILILSAEFGLISGEIPIPHYDRRMDRAQAEALRPLVGQFINAYLTSRAYTATFICFGAEYTSAFVVPTDLQARLGILTIASGGIGTRLGQLRRWLNSDE